VCVCVCVCVCLPHAPQQTDAQTRVLATPTVGNNTSWLKTAVQSAALSAPTAYKRCVKDICIAVWPGIHSLISGANLHLAGKVEWVAVVSVG
jgi:hypothetical protein